MYEITIKGTTAEEIRAGVSDLAKLLDKFIPIPETGHGPQSAIMNPFSVVQPPIQPPAPNAAAAYQIQQPVQQTMPNPAAGYQMQPPMSVPVAQQPIMPPQQPAVTVPTTNAPAYTMEQIAVAATPLADAGRRQEISDLLGQFGVQALTQLPKEQYGAFATALRGMGAKI